jgi:hypothetical protein
MTDGFCGWYFKCQGEEGQTLALIPAVHSRDGERSGSIQLISERGSWNVTVPGSKVRVDPDKPRAALGENRFSEAGVHLELADRRLRAEGELRFGPPCPLRYDIMGPFRHLPMMECSHSVFSMRHRVDGTLRINGRTYTFRDGVGYIEGDRGRSFPRRYAWTQCAFPSGSLMLSVAEVPLGPVRFTGVIGVVWLRGQEYRLATYLGARAQRVREGTLVVRQGPLRLTAIRLEEKAHALRAPKQGQMSRLIRENVACPAYYRLTRGEEVLLELTAERAAFEFEYG